MTIKLDTNLANYKYDMERCRRCGGCKWVDHIYMPGVKFGIKCPSIAYWNFDSYAAYGRELIAHAVLEGKLKYTDELLRAVYACQLCGACDAGCKRNLDLEPGLVLEALRIKLVEDGAGPLPQHKKVAGKIAESHNRYGSPHASRLKWLPDDVKQAGKADILYFVGCASSYTRTEIARATAGILSKTKANFMVSPNEWCCGYPLYSTGLLEDFKKQMAHNLEMVKKSGAGTIITSCAECYKTWKVDYPKVLGKSTKDMGYRVLHITEYLNDLKEKGQLNLKNRIDLKVTYHDSCNVARMSEPWTYWEGERGKWGLINPPRDYRRGTYGIYAQPRAILSGIPGLELVEMTRIRENAWCCGSGGGVRDAFKDFSLSTARERLVEARETGAEAIVSCCPYCKQNFTDAADKSMKAYDITELVSQSLA